MKLFAATQLALTTMKSATHQSLKILTIIPFGYICSFYISRGGFRLNIYTMLSLPIAEFPWR